MRISAHFMRLRPMIFMHEISCNNIEEFTIPCMIPEICMQPAGILQVSAMHVTCMHYCLHFMHGVCIFNACSVHVPCIESGAFHA